ncbi:hypothetical protein GCM10020295_57520 [Streptomyces cinereospinus]
MRTGLDDRGGAVGSAADSQQAPALEGGACSRHGESGRERRRASRGPHKGAGIGQAPWRALSAQHLRDAERVFTLSRIHGVMPPAQRGRRPRACEATAPIPEHRHQEHDLAWSALAPTAPPAK